MIFQLTNFGKELACLNKEAKGAGKQYLVKRPLGPLRLELAIWNRMLSEQLVVFTISQKRSLARKRMTLRWRILPIVDFLIRDE